MAWQYCENYECGAEIDPDVEDILRGNIVCTRCGEVNEVAMLDDERTEILVEMYKDIQLLKERIL